MAATPQPARYRPETAILSLPDTLYDPVAAARFPQTTLRFRNDRAARQVGLDTLDDAAWVDHFGRFAPLPGTLRTPLALRYHGHQFRVYNPEIGDGRGFLFAQMRDDRGRLMDLGTKGSGRTPWSRFGDGRLTLKGGMREILATEMLEARGVDTSRSFSLIETGEALERGDEPSPTRSAVLVRLSHGHIRIGAFQRLAYEDDAASMRALVGYVLRELYDDDADHGEDAPARLLDRVVAATARLAGQYMAAGFVHGVLNSDNINVTGESFDYGPWRFAPTWDPTFVAAYFDHAGLYAFGRQPEAIHWDVAQLAIALRTIAEAQPLVDSLETFASHYQAAMTDAILWRLGVASQDEAADHALVQIVEHAMRTSGVGIDRFFHDAFGGTLPASAPYDTAPFATLRSALSRRHARTARNHTCWRRSDPVSLMIDEVETIWHAIAERDDWQPFHAKIAAIRDYGDALRA